ncbi:hypothetical protein K8R43_04580 [archaeon]|nr:hypothetical protein [archaeon]
MKVWEEVIIAVGVVVVLLAGVVMTVFGVAGLAYIGTTGYTVQNSGTYSVVYGLLVLVGLALVYDGVRKAPTR